MTEQEAYDELSLYTLSHGDPSFIHQYIVDAYAAAHASENIKPIKTAFALVGLYLALEKGYSGRRVQRVHMEMARKRKQWPRFEAPQEKPAMTVYDVLGAPPGAARDEAIRRWCGAVWDTWKASHKKIADLAHETLGLPE